MVAEGRLWLSEPLADGDFRDYRRRAIFEGAKWDVQIHDHCALSRQALVVRADAWREVAVAAAELAGELELAERGLLAALREGRLRGMDRASRRWLTRGAAAGGSPEVPRLVRFDFHPTAEGWAVSEGNCDVPGGINEASHLARSWPGTAPGLSVGDPAAAYADAIAGAAGSGPVALVHATAFSDDWQLLKFLADLLAARGIATIPADPGAIAWRNGWAAHEGTRLGAILRFFPGDWLVRTDFAPAWFGPGETPVFNPVTSLAVQNKRFPLFARQAGLALPALVRFLPPVEPVTARGLGDGRLVIKPAYGRVGEGIGLAGVTPPRQLLKIRAKAALFPRLWLLQRRFDTLPLGDPAGFYPCLGVYTLGRQVIGAYGRLSPTRVIDINALDAPVFVAEENGHGRGRLLQ